MKRAAAILSLLALLPAPPALLRAQAPPGKDPMGKIKALFEKARKAMDKIDDALLGADPVKAGDPAKMKRSLRKARENQKIVIETIDEILKNLPSSQSQGGGGGKCKNPSSSDSRNRPKPGSKPRRREKKPDLVKQKKSPSPKSAGKKGKTPKKKSGEKRGPSNPRNPRNRKGSRPPKNPIGKKRPQSGRETWGNLPLFLRDVFREEQAPKLPPKYLPFWKAFLKRSGEKK